MQHWTGTHVLAAALLAVAAGGCGAPDAAGGSSPEQNRDALAASAPAKVEVDPGRSPWQPVPPSEVRSVCGLDPEKLWEADVRLGVPWAAIRHGRLCHAFGATENSAPEDALSMTKTMAGVVTGAVAYATRDLVRTGPKTGPFSDSDLAGYWLDHVSYNPDARVGHVLSMVAQNADLSLGHKVMQYDFLGNVQIDSIGDMVTAAIAQDPARFGADLDQFARRFVFEPLGMAHSTWSNGAAKKTYAFGWSTTVLDAARLGLLMLNGGVWSGQRIVSSDWLYRMTHPAFEDANTAYGYLTWLNAASNYSFGGIPVRADWSGVQQVPRSPGPCAPVAVYPVHPHGLSTSPDCNYRAPYSCDQMLDDGVWQAVGIWGKIIQGHPGLDLLLVVQDSAPLTFGVESGAALWDAVRPAVVAADPVFHGSETAFCVAYGGNRYAPDL